MDKVVLYFIESVTKRMVKTPSFLLYLNQKILSKLLLIPNLILKTQPSNLFLCSFLLISFVEISNILYNSFIYTYKWRNSYMRKLASIQIVNDVRVHTNADSLEMATINGWSVIVKKGEFQTGDLGVYFEIDSFLPLSDNRYAFLQGPTATFDGVEGRRIKTIKLRGELAQGLILPLSLFPEIKNTEVGKDVSQVIAIVKYEKPMPTSDDAIGFLPSNIDKTAQERIQNLLNIDKSGVWERTEKLEGCSLSMYFDYGDFRVCSKNLVIKESNNSAYWEMAYKYNVKERLEKLGRNITLQGEIVGPNIEDNVYKIGSYKYYIYTIFDMDKKRKLLPSERKQVLKELNEMEGLPLLTVPFLGDSTLPQEENWFQILLQEADGYSELNPKVRREGIVFQNTEKNISFKVISNAYLLNQK
jgi:RNA ligase (TIGR02306 family)